MSWAKDGNALVGELSEMPDWWDNTVVIYPLDGRPFRKLTKGHSPLWSTDESLIYFLRERSGETELWAIPPDPKEDGEHLVTKLGTMPDIAHFYDVSMKNEVVWVAAEQGNRELWIVDLEGE